MKTRRTYLGVVGVVSLALGANAAAATFDLDKTPKRTIYYAKETLTEAQKATDGATYYEVSGGTIGATDNKITAAPFKVKGKVGIGGPAGTVMRIRYDFTNMVLSYDPTLIVHGIKTDDTAGVNAEGVIRSGGGAGGSFVTFIVTRGDDTASRTVIAELTISKKNAEGKEVGKIAVSPDAPVSITMTVTDDLGGTADEYTSSYPAAIRVGEALVAKSVPENATASVVEDFMRFTGTSSPVLKVNLGTFSIKLGDPNPDKPEIFYRNAADAQPSELQTNLIKKGEQAKPTSAASGSFAMVQGDFSFASKVTLQPVAAAATINDATCSDTAADMLIRDTAGKVTNTTALMPFVIPNDGDISLLCIHVDGETVIPRGLTPYSVALDFEPAITGAKFPPADRSLDLGRILHDGTAVRFPYLTTYPGYNQRIVIVNEGEAVRYGFDFTSEADVSATALGDAAGMLPARQTTVLRVGDIVEVMGGSRTAGTLTIVADPATVEVAVTQVNLETRGTDTLYVDAETNLE